MNGRHGRGAGDLVAGVFERPTPPATGSPALQLTTAHMLKATILREYDIRGAADIELLDAGVETLGQAFGTYLRRPAGRKVNLGRGTRLSSPRLRDALMRGLKVVRRARAELRARHKTVDVAGVRPCSCKAGAWSAHPIPSLSR